jgi:hypothetical protein
VGTEEVGAGGEQRLISIMRIKAAVSLHLHMPSSQHRQSQSPSAV